MLGKKDWTIALIHGAIAFVITKKSHACKQRNTAQGNKGGGYYDKNTNNKN